MSYMFVLSLAAIAAHNLRLWKAKLKISDAMSYKTISKKSGYFREIC